MLAQATTYQGRKTMTFESIKLEVSEDLAILTLNQPSSRNGLTVVLQKEMLAALEQLGTQDAVRALILTGAGRSFCSGGDLGELDNRRGSGVSVGESVAKMMAEISNPLILALQNLPMPIVSAVNGAAAGAGISLALAADIVVAARSAFFLTPFLPRLGIVPDLGTTWFLPQRVGRARAMGLMLLGDRLPAEKAAEWGLIWSCVDDGALMEEARKIAGQLAKAPAHSALEARRALDAAGNQGLAAQLDYEKERQRYLLDLPSFKEGAQAFFEKREPIFKK
ncbi:enoyl-CoA hydratase-related protein [Polaromonas aquatica]|uniref:Enoyl-CoA hydratase-related protein n=3 Tax=Polaromonas TaxID=52972 RepID=A0ABW1TSW4_9BURK